VWVTFVAEPPAVTELRVTLLAPRVIVIVSPMARLLTSPSRI
jgi:hypothetical protein